MTEGAKINDMRGFLPSYQCLMARERYKAKGRGERRATATIMSKDGVNDGIGN